MANSLIIVSAMVAVGCTRSEQTEEFASQVVITMPRASDFRKASEEGILSSLPSGFKTCFGIHVGSADIPVARANSCSPAVGILSGTVGEGESLTVSVPKGSGRNFELIAYLAPPGDTCPVLSPDFLSTHARLSRTYVVGSANGVALNLDETVVSISLSFPGLFASMGSAQGSVCLPEPSLKAYLTSGGDVINAQGNAMESLGSPILQSLYYTGLGDARAIGRISTSGHLNFGSSSEATLPSWLESFSRKPDVGEIYGLDQAGSLYRININSSGVGTATKLTASDCPFEVSGCVVPPWIQSISAGFGKRLYGLDHGGQLYILGSGAPVPISIPLPAIAVQAAYF